MVADAWHECREHRKMNAAGSDIPIRLGYQWVIMVSNDDSESDTEVPIAFCPWCGLDLVKACQSRDHRIREQVKP